MSRRQYERRFDWDEARRLYADGLSIRQIALQVGVTWSAVQRVVEPEAYERAAAYSLSRKGKGVCVDCGGPTHESSKYQGSTRCTQCATALRVTSARDGELLCFGCKQWKPDDDFPMNRGSRVARRDRHSYCRSCQTVARREYRHRNIEKQRAYDRQYTARRRAEARKDNDPT